MNKSLLHSFDLVQSVKMKRLDNLMFNIIGFIYSEILEIRVSNYFYPI